MKPGDVLTLWATDSTSTPLHLKVTVCGRCGALVPVAEDETHSQHHTESKDG